MHIAIFSQTPADIALIARSLPAHHCHRVQHRTDLRHAAPQLLIVDIASAGAHLQEILQSAGTPAMPVLLLAADVPAELAALTAAATSALIDWESKPLRRHALTARVTLLLQRAYPGHDARQSQQFGTYLFESPSHIVRRADMHVTLTQKEFDLALLLFNNLDRPLSRAYLLEAVWGQEEANDLTSRTIDTHVSRVRSKLHLKPEHGFKLSTVYGYGYQLERLAAPAA